MVAPQKAPGKKTATKAVTVKEVAGRLDKVVESTNKAVGDLSNRIDANQKALMDALNNLAVPNNGVKASDVPASFNTKRVESMEEDLGEAVALSDEDDSMIEGTNYKDTESPEFANKMAFMNFMREPVKVHIHDSFSDESVPVFDISVNGRSYVFRYGETKIVPRYVIEGLARAKPIHYQNEKYKKQDGSDSVRHPARRGLRFPFSIEEDRNPRGAQWLRTILAQP